MKSNCHDARKRARNKPLMKSLTGLILALAAALCSAQDTGYRVEVVADNLRWPWSVAGLPEGGFLVTERGGQLLHLRADGSRTVIKGSPDTLFAGQGGYFDVVLHPRFRKNHLVYLSYAKGTPEANTTAIFRAVLSGGELSEGRDIVRAKPDRGTPQHYGGRMLFLPDETLLLTTGEGFEYREQAQDLESELGKVLRVDDRGRPVGADRETPPGQERIFTYGHRNPQGLVLDPDSGAIYLHEHGPRGGDELNVLQPGLNYGWPAVTHGVDYSGAYVSPFSSAPDMESPIWVWVPSIAPSGMALYRGNRFPLWKNSLFVGALVNRELRRLSMSAGQVVEETSLLGELGERIRDVRVINGDIYVLTDSESGRLLRLMPDDN
jgi:glucose/arabinose dehydrogenase